jgi:RNA polymerase sigma-70 factor (ECF subfamily)
VPGDTLTEVDLARQMLAGNAEAFERFVDTFRAKVFQYSFLMCRQREDAEEVAQETLLKVFESIDQLRQPERVKPWVFQIAKNVCLMKRRRSIFAPDEISLDERRLSGEGTERRIEVADTNALPDAQLLLHEMQYLVHTAITELPPMYRAVLLLRDVEGLSTEETAGVLGLSMDVVKTRLHRARLMLRSRLEPVLSAHTGA